MPSRGRGCTSSICPLFLSAVAPYTRTRLSLLKASEEWKIQTVLVSPLSYSHGDIWTLLARSAATGHIGNMKFRFNKGKTGRSSKEDVRAVWEIAETFEVEVIDGDYPGTLIRIGGGRGARMKTIRYIWLKISTEGGVSFYRDSWW